MLGVKQEVYAPISYLDMDKQEDSTATLWPIITRAASIYLWVTQNQRLCLSPHPRMINNKNQYVAYMSFFRVKTHY